MHTRGNRALPAPLAHVYWIGGPPDAGKSTVAATLAERFGLQVYHEDRHEMEHLRRADPGTHPLHASLLAEVEGATAERSFFERWVERDAEDLADEALANWAERTDLVCDDLLAMTGVRPIIAEGPGFFPDVIQPLIARARQAIWLVPTDGFKRASHTKRDKSRWRIETSNPGRVRAMHIERDLLIARHYRDEVTARDYHGLRSTVPRPSMLSSPG